MLKTILFKNKKTYTKRAHRKNTQLIFMIILLYIHMYFFHHLHDNKNKNKILVFMAFMFFILYIFFIMNKIVNCELKTASNRKT